MFKKVFVSLVFLSAVPALANITAESTWDEIKASPNTLIVAPVLGAEQGLRINLMVACYDTKTSQFVSTVATKVCTQQKAAPALGQVFECTNYSETFARSPRTVAKTLCLNAEGKPILNRMAKCQQKVVYNQELPLTFKAHIYKKSAYVPGLKKFLFKKEFTVSECKN